MPWLTDETILADIVALTAEFRHRIIWAGARRLLADRGIDPMKCVQLSCDRGDDVNTVLVLPDGSAVSLDVKEDRQTREDVSISRWRVLDWDDEREVMLVRGIILGPDSSSFDERVRAYFEQHWGDRDKPLPP